MRFATKKCERVWERNKVGKAQELRERLPGIAIGSWEALPKLACNRKCVLGMAVHAEHAHAGMAAPANTHLLLFACTACSIPQEQTLWLCSKATDKARWCVAFKSSPTVAA